MVKISPLEELFTRTVRNLFSAGSKLARILPQVESRTDHEGLKTTFAELLTLTESHMARLELISRRHGFPLTERGAIGMRELIGEIENALAAKSDPFITNLTLIGLTRKAEHYLRATSRSARAQAAALGWPHALATMDVIIEEGEEIATALRRWTAEIAEVSGGVRVGKPCFTLNAGRRNRATASSRRA